MSDILSEWEGRWRTDLGAWFPGERVVLRGRDLMSDVGRKPWMAVLLFGITGREFTAEQIRLFEGIWSISTSFPEPRLWNNRIAAITGSARSSSALGVSAGVAVSEAIVYGHRPLLATMDFLRRCVSHVTAGKNLRELLATMLNADVRGSPGAGKNRQLAKIPGFGRPITSRDERIAALYALASELGFRNGNHVLMAEKVQNTLLEMGHEWYMNISVLMGAMAADQELSTKEYYHYIILCFCAGLIPCAFDALENPEGAFFPLRCENIRYVGFGPRKWSEV